MQLSDFSYVLPPELIAHYPPPQRTASRLLVMDAVGAIQHRQFSDIVDFLRAGDLLVLNNTRVLAARLFAQKVSGGAVEILIERIESEYVAVAHVRSSKSPKAGATLLLRADEARADVTALSAVMQEREGSLFRLVFNQPVLTILEQIGHMPLPPYMERRDEKMDWERYQTVYAKEHGAVAAPTAGLHFDEELLEKIKTKNIATAFVTLHVGAGTFQPVRVDDVNDHHMHAEFIDVPQATCDAVKACKARGGRVVAVGTTSVRSLESASVSGSIQPYSGDTDIFIYPGKPFNCVDAMITNFHLPQSTLLMLVSAFAGFKHVMHTYNEAIKENYRFFSYGDAMFITRNHNNLTNIAAEVEEENV